MPNGTCSVDGCERPAKSRGWCDSHYRRWRRNGDPGNADLSRPIAGACGVEGCDRRSSTKVGFCSTHYLRWTRNGDPGDAAIGRDRPEPQCCIIEDCDKPAVARGWCETHYSRWRHVGDPGLVLSRAGQANPNWRGDDVGYIGAHKRVRKERGKASSYECVECGATAGDWAYDHADPHHLIAQMESGVGMLYSLNPDHYQPMCKSCHRKFDLSMASR